MIALAEPQTIDLEAMNYADLMELRESVDNALANFPEWNGIVVPEGVYEIGVDIPAGKYTLLFARDSWWGVLKIYSTKEKIKQEEHEDRFDIRRDRATVIEFEEGTFITTDDPIYFKKFAGFGFSFD